MATSFHVGDVGAIFRVTVVKTDGVTPFDVSAATSIVMNFLSPTGTTKSFAASKVTTGTDGKVFYSTSSAGDLDVAGSWKLQVVVTVGAGPLHSDVVAFKVKPNIL